ncbi:MAG: CCA-adding enzyme [Methanomassiliicoccales archaeon PtaU1.Bin124]|nr:MAG: CCA-adding enzyme [Methanomassiliicoccales archaeon PtaU1.Bin124]
MRLEQEIGHKIRPTAGLEKEVKAATDRLVSAVRARTSMIESVMEIKVVGSVAKGTYVSRPDIDVFILFSEGTPRPEMDRIGLEIGRDLLEEREERYAEHPYVHGMFDGFEADIVPCYGIKDPSTLMSAVDRTPFHTDYMLSHLKAGQRDEVRVLKQFMKGIGAYGAEAKVQGFSGYLVELLILRYGDFRTVIERASKWKYGTKIEIEGKGQMKFDSPLVFYDPVDKNRNVASALSTDKFALFIHACAEYSQCPDERFFFPRKRDVLTQSQIDDIIDSIGMKVLSVEADRPVLIDDNLYPQARKTLDGIATVLEHEGFQVQAKHLHVEKERIQWTLLLENDVLSRGRKHVGPPVWMENSQDFLRRWRAEGLGAPFIEDGRWVVFVERKFTSAKAAVEGSVQSAAMGSAFKNVELRVFDDKESRKGGMESALSGMLDKRQPWEIS